MNVDNIDKVIMEFVQYFNLENYYLLILVYNHEIQQWQGYNSGNGNLFYSDAGLMNSQEKYRTMQQLNQFLEGVTSPYVRHRISNPKPKKSDEKDEIIAKQAKKIEEQDEIIAKQAKKIKQQDEIIAKQDEIIEEQRLEIKALKEELQNLKMMFAKHMEEFHGVKITF